MNKTSAHTHFQLMSYLKPRYKWKSWFWFKLNSSSNYNSWLILSSSQIKIKFNDPSLVHSKSVYNFRKYYKIQYNAFGRYMFKLCPHPGSNQSPIPGLSSCKCSRFSPKPKSSNSSPSRPKCLVEVQCNGKSAIKPKNS